MTASLFASYSHHDTKIVTALVQLLRINKEVVFFDHDSIELGTRWRQQIREAILNANILILFWCEHTSHSIEVKKEYQLARRHKKNIIPILLDDTPLPSSLRAYQYLSFASAVQHEKMAIIRPKSDGFHLLPADAAEKYILSLATAVEEKILISLGLREEPTLFLRMRPR